MTGVPRASLPRRRNEESTAGVDHVLSDTGLLERIVRSGGPVLVVNRDGRRTFANDAARRLLDTADAALVGGMVGDVVPWLDGTPFADAWLRALSGEATVRVEAAIPGSGRWVGAVLVPGPADVVIHLADTTDRHRAELTEDHLRRALEVSSIAGRTGPFLIDLEADVSHVSETVRAIYGLDATMGSSIPREITRALIHPEDRDRVEAMIRAVAAGSPGVGDVTYRIHRHDTGEERLVRAVGEVIRDLDGGARTLVGSLSDLTEPAATADALRATEARLRRMVEGVDAIIAYQEDGDSPRVIGPQVERILGYRSDEIRDNDAWNALVHPDDLPACLEAWRGPAFAWDIEYRIRRRNGTWAWLNDRGRRIVHDGGRRPGMFGVGVDVTARVDAVAAVRASETRLRALTESAADGVVTIDGYGTVVGWNPAAERLFGYAEAEIIGRPVADLMPPDIAEQHLAALARFRAHGPARLLGRTIELAGRRRDGSEFPMELSLADWTVPAGRFATAIIRDISERQATEAAAREATERLGRLAEYQRRVFDAMAEGVTVQDRTGSLTTANVRASEILGLDMAAAVGQQPQVPPWTSIHEDGSPYPLPEHPALATLATGRPVRDEVMGLVFPDGRTTWIRMNTEPILDPDGTVAGVVTSFADVTLERELEAQLRQAQRLEAVGQLAGGVAHDFNNLLGAIRGYGELAHAALEPTDPVRADLEQILLAADRAAAITRQLLAFSRRSVVKPRPVEPAAAVDLLAPMLRRLLGEHIEVVIERDPDPGSVLMDPGQLDQVLINLAVNARDAMPDGGRLTLTVTATACPVIAGETGGPPVPAVRITVQDTGSGMAPAVMARIFEPFFTTKEAGKGTGMGLATVYGIVRQARGHIEASSAPGAGTTFVIDLPVTGALPDDEPDPVPVPLPEDPAADPRERPVVLVTEDDPALRTLLARILGRGPYRVLVAASGAEAIAIAAGAPRLDLLVSDVRMPGMQGPELVRRMRAARPALPVLFISAFAAELATGEELLGPVHVLDKPFSADALGAAVGEAIRAAGS